MEDSLSSTQFYIPTTDKILQRTHTSLIRNFNNRILWWRKRVRRSIMNCCRTMQFLKVDLKWKARCICRHSILQWCPLGKPKHKLRVRSKVGRIQSGIHNSKRQWKLHILGKYSCCKWRVSIGWCRAHCCKNIERTGRHLVLMRTQGDTGTG